MLRVNCETPGRELSRRLESLTKRMRKRLAEIGLLDGQTATANLSLREHVDEFYQGLLARSVTAAHAKLTRRRVLDVFDGCCFRFWSDIQAAKVEQYLADRRALPDRRRKRLSRRSSNYYLQSVRQFCRWMVSNGRAAASPLARLKPLNAAVDRRERRAITVDELRRLLAAAEAGRELFGVAGPERALLYRLAVESGLRANELRSLTRASFHFAAKLSTVTVEATSSKRRRRDELPLRPGTADKLKRHLADRHPGTPAFTLPRRDVMAEMTRRDLRAAREAWLGEAADDADRLERAASTFLLAPLEAEVNRLGRCLGDESWRPAAEESPLRPMRPQSEIDWPN